MKTLPIIIAMAFGSTVMAETNDREPTFYESADEIIEAYNKVTSNLVKTYKLPSKRKMIKSSKNPTRLTYQYFINPNISIEIVVDKTTNKPVALGMYSLPKKPTDLIDEFIVRTYLGATIYGKGADAGELSKLCLEIRDKKINVELPRIVKGLYVFCGKNDDGIWISGIAKDIDFEIPENH